MKKLTLLFSVLPVFVYAQVNYDFEGSFPELWLQFPFERWEIDHSRPISGTGSLHHSFDNSEGSTDNLSLFTGIPDLNQGMEWFFSIRYEGNPSSANNWLVWLLSELPASGFYDGGGNSGLMIGVNQTSANDSVCVYGMIAGDIFEVGYTDLLWEDLPENSFVRFHLSLDKEGRLSLYSGSNPEAVNPSGVFSVSGLESLNAAFFGISYRYTSSRDRLLWFDDLYIEASLQEDLSPPELELISFPDNQSLCFQFNESLLLDPRPSISSKALPPVRYLDVGSEDLCFGFVDSLSRGITYDFLLADISDHAGNRGEVRDSFRFFIPERHEILFSEILPDPSPAIYLPECEFLELYNHSDLNVATRGWMLTVGNKTYGLPASLIPPGGFTVLISSACRDLYPGAISITDAESFLVNSGSVLVLSNQTGSILDAMTYNEHSWVDPYKKEGGWSLERTDLNNLCGGSEIWESSRSPEGGTPGGFNSMDLVVPDHTGPVPLGIYYHDSLSWQIEFSEELDTLGIEAGLTFPALDRKSYKFELLPPFFKEVFVHFAYPFAKVHGTISSEVSDCFGNPSGYRDTLIFTRPERPEYLDVIITEIMFDPIDPGPEFIELYNRSGKTISMDDITLQVNTEGKEGRKISLGEKKFLFPPGNYLVLAENRRAIGLAYPYPEHRWVFESAEFPSLPDGGGQIRLLDKGEELLDEVSYSEADHFSFLDKEEGVSLERVFLDRQPGIRSTWVSASWDSGGATPGYQNSQDLSLPVSNSSFSTEYPLFTPDNDGDRDLAVFHYSLNEGNYTGSFMIFNAKGQRLFLQTGINPGTSGTLVWNGEDLSGQLCPTGIYLAYFECLETVKGQVKRFKRAITLSR